MTVQLDRVIIAKSKLLQLLPRWGLTVANMKLVEDTQCSTGWIDGRTVGFNPLWTMDLSTVQLIGWLAHEAEHVMRKHHIRGKGFDHSVFNIACDMVINGDLQHHYKFSLPKDGFIDYKQHMGKSAEEVYREIFQKKIQLPDQLLSACGLKSDSSEKSSGNPISDQQQKNEESSEQQNGKESSEQQENKESSEQDKKDSKNQNNNNDPMGCGEVKQFPIEKLKENGSEKTRDEIMQEIENESKAIDRKIMQSAMAQERINSIQPGSKIGSVIREAKQQLTGPIDVKTALQQFIEKTMKTDYSFRIPNKRYRSNGFILPSLCKTDIHKLLVYVDVSGSILQHELNIYSSIMTQMLHVFPAIVLHTYYFDTQLRKSIPDIFTIDSTPINFKICGGGGTNYQRLFLDIDDNDKFNILGAVIFTDLDCYSYPFAPEFPVVWMVTKNKKTYLHDVEFGETIFFNQDNWKMS